MTKDYPTPAGPPPAEALAARPLLEQVAKLGDCIGQHTLGEIRTISSRAAAWLEENPPGQPAAIEPRGCPTPGACSCVEPAPPPEGPTDEKPRLTVQEISDLPIYGGSYIHECWTGEIQLDGDFTRAQLRQLADSIPTAEPPSASPAAPSP